jgi:hypothetical protein
MKRLICALVVAAPMFAAVSGVVINGTTGKPQAGATVGLNRLGQGGIELIDQAKSGPDGRFTINQEVRGPHVLRTVFDGVSYNHMLPPGSPTTNLTLDVYNSSSTQPGEAKVTKHMILFEPAGDKLSVNETYMFQNAGKKSWNEPEHGTLHFFLPDGAGGKVQVNATAPNGMPIPAAVTKTNKPDVFGVDFAIKPGETRFDLTYTTPYAAGEAYKGKVITKDENTYLIAPNGVTMTGTNLNDLGQEPRTQAHIFGLQGQAYEIKLTGAEAAAPPASAAAGDSGGDQQQESGPPVEAILPRINGMAIPIVGAAAGILALGFVLLYRSTPKESNERGRG